MAITGAALAQDDVVPPNPPEAAPQSPAQAARLRKIQAEVALGRLERRKDLRERFESRLSARVEAFDRHHGLSPAQRKKLLLAGRVDIERYFSRMDEREVYGLSAASQDLFDQGSMFAKVLANTLTKEQIASEQVLERELAALRHRATLDWVLGTWDQSVGLDVSQHERLKALLIQETRPPRRFGADDYYGVLCQLGRVPEATLKSIFTETQWATLQPQFALAKQMEPNLKKSGYVPDQDVAVVPGPARPPATEAEKKRG